MTAEPVKLSCPECGKKLRLPDRSILGKKVRCPACQTPFVAALPESPPDDLSPPSPSKVSPPSEDFLNTTGPVSESPILGEIQIQTRAPGIRRSRKTTRKMPGWVTGILVGGVLAIGIGLSAYILVYQPAFQIRATPASSVPVSKIATSSPSPEVGIVEGHPASVPLNLKHLPGGIRLVVSLRPYDLLERGISPGELLQVSGTSGIWFAEQVRKLAFVEFSEVDELLLGWILGSPQDPPRFVCRVRGRQEWNREQFAERLGKEFHTGEGTHWRQSDTTAMQWIDDRTFVVFPVELSSEIAQAAESPLPTDLGIEELLLKSSDENHFTVVGIPHDLRTHQSQLCDPTFFSGWEAILQFLEQDHRHAEAFLFNTHWGTSGTSLTLRIKASNTAKMNDVRSVVETRLSQLPGSIQLAVASEHLPPGFMSFLRRFPAMIREVTQTQTVGIIDRQVVVRALTSERALPNLLLGGVLLWHNQFVQSTPPTAETSEVSSVSPPRKVIPLTERLQQRIDVDFRREPLESALQTVAQELSSPIEIDGEALKLAGYTRNMPQTLQLSQFPAGGVLQKILMQYDQMVLAVIEGTPETLLLTTREAARAKQLKTLSLELKERQPPVTGKSVE